MLESVDVSRARIPKVDIGDLANEHSPHKLPPPPKSFTGKALLGLNESHITVIYVRR